MTCCRTPRDKSSDHLQSVAKCSTDYLFRLARVEKNMRSCSSVKRGAGCGFELARIHSSVAL